MWNLQREMRGLKAVLLDLDGVLYDGERPIPQAAPAVAWLRAQAIPHLFVTNTTSRPRAALVAKLAALGIPADVERVATPAVAAARWLRERLARVCATSRADTTHSSAAPAAVALFVPAATRAEFAGLPVLDDAAESGAGFVVVGDLGDEWDFARLNRAFRLLISNAQAQLIALGMTRYWRAKDGLRLDVAPFVTALEHATGRAPIVLGKPAAEFYRSALAQLRVPVAEAADVARIAMVGDDVLVDVAAAQQVGMREILVRTGKFEPADLQRGVAPDAVLDSIGDLPAWWQQQTRR